MSKSLRQSPKAMDYFFSLSPDLLCIAGFDGYFKNVNPAWERVLGWTQEELTSKPYIEFIHPDDRDATAVKANEIIEGATIVHFENRYRHKDGSYRWLEWTALPVATESMIYATARDRTDQKLQDDAFKDNEERLSLALDSAQTGAWDLDMIHDTAIRSLRHDQIFGYSSLQPTWGSAIFFRHVLAEDRDMVQRKFQEAVETGTLLFECRIRWPDTSIHWIIARGRVYYDDVQTPVRMLGTVNDITKRKQQEEEIERTQLFLNSIIENIPDMIFVKDARELRFVRFNKAGEELLGYRRKDLMGKNDYDFFPKKEADFFIQKDQEVLKSKRLLDIPSEQIQTLHKGERILHTKKIPILDKDGNPKYLLGISEDITESQREEKAKAEFVTLVSHQLRTPLAAMRWSFEILKERTEHFSDTELRLVNQSYMAMLNMAQTIDTMLAIAHIDTGKIIVDLSDLCLTDVIKPLVETSSVEAQNRHLDLTLHTSTDCCFKSDANLLREIFSNLLSNAMQYTTDGGKIDIRIRQEGEEAVVTVQDTGIGIAANDVHSIFEKLFRAENAKKMRAGGSGLGLYVVRSLVTLLGGTVSVISEEGKGSTFAVRLPLSPRVIWQRKQS